jgi:hypothetical protein
MLSYNESDKTKKKYPLIRALGSLFAWQYIGAIPAKAASIAARYSQTFVMAAAIRYLETPSHERSRDYAYGLIVATALSYFGSMVSIMEKLKVSTDILTTSYFTSCSAINSTA